MISGISFTGREGLLVKAGQTAVKPAEEYVHEGTYFSKEAREAVAARIKKAKTDAEVEDKTHRFLPQTELTGVRPSNNEQVVGFVSDSYPIGAKVDYKA